MVDYFGVGTQTLWIAGSDEANLHVRRRVGRGMHRVVVEEEQFSSIGDSLDSIRCGHCSSCKLHPVFWSRRGL